jgi:hypothetical protein
MEEGTHQFCYLTSIEITEDEYIFRLLPDIYSVDRHGRLTIDTSYRASVYDIRSCQDYYVMRAYSRLHCDLERITTGKFVINKIKYR